MILVLMNHREFTTESNNTKLSIIRFCRHWSICTHSYEMKVIYLVTLLKEYLVVFAEGYTEDNRGDVLKTMYPFLSFTALTTDIEHAVVHCQRDQAFSTL